MPTTINGRSSPLAIGNLLTAPAFFHARPRAARELELDWRAGREIERDRPPAVALAPERMRRTARIPCLEAAGDEYGVANRSRRGNRDTEGDRRGDRLTGGGVCSGERREWLWAGATRECQQ